MEVSASAGVPARNELRIKKTKSKLMRKGGEIYEINYKDKKGKAKF